MATKEYLISLVKNDIGGHKDNLYRATMAKKNNPSWKSGNGETIESVIESYQSSLDTANKALKELSASVLAEVIS